MDAYGRLSIALWEYLEGCGDSTEWAHADIMDRVEEWAARLEGGRAMGRHMRRGELEQAWEESHEVG